jgi:hypothetical protein
MPLPWRTPFGPPPQPPYMIGFEHASGRIVRASTADSLVLGQADLIRVATTLSLLGVQSRVVLVHTPTGQIRERVIVAPSG